MLVVWMSLGPKKNPDYEENCERGTKRKKNENEKKKRSFSKLPNRRLQEVKGKTLLH